LKTTLSQRGAEYQTNNRNKNMKRITAYITVLTLLILPGVAHADDAYTRNRAAAIARAEAIKAAQARRDAEEAAKRQKEAIAATQRKQQADSLRNGTGQKTTVPRQAICNRGAQAAK
jgi:hypothetical protein